jgi:FkbM family methyltransferase
MLSQIKTSVKEKIYNKLGLPYSRYGLPIALLKHLPIHQPINLIDIGAHNGWFTHAVADYCGVSQSLLIEPLPHKSDYLRQIFTLPKYSVVECVVSDNHGTINLEVNEAEETSSILNIKRYMPELSVVNLSKSQTIQCQSKTLDTLIDEFGFTNIDLIKIDVQGAEHLVIRGSTNTLKITNMIWIEVSFKPLYEGSSVFADIYSLLNHNGFRLMEIEPGFRSPSNELLQADVLFGKI